MMHLYVKGKAMTTLSDFVGTAQRESLTNVPSHPKFFITLVPFFLYVAHLCKIVHASDRKLYGLCMVLVFQWVGVAVDL